MMTGLAAFPQDPPDGLRGRETQTWPDWPATFTLFKMF
jgi:hypothetical protein